MAVNGQLTLAVNAPQQIHAATNVFPGAPNTYVTFTNGAAVSFLGGGAGVTSANGLALAANQTVNVVCGPGDQLWVVSATISTVSFYKNETFVP